MKYCPRMMSGALLALIVGLGACAAEETEPAPPPMLEEESESLNCGGPSPAERYHDGITKTSDSGRFSVTILTSTPAPPVKGDNSLTLLVTENEQPVPSSTVFVSPFMPHHNHGTAPADYNGVTSDEGLFEIPPFYLFMPGYWEYTVTIEGNDGIEDTTVFAFCVDG